MAKDGIDRTERLLALILIGQTPSASQRDKVLKLNVAGFTNVEIADLLGMSGASVAQALYEARKPKRGRSRTSTSR